MLARIVLCLVVVSSGFLSPSAASRADAATISFDVNGGEEHGFFGPNAPVSISGTLTGGCVDMFGNTAADVYVVRHGSVTASSIGPFPDQPVAVITSQLSNGAYLDETIGFAKPTGAFGDGNFDVILDLCRTGIIDPSSDLIFGEGNPLGAFTVSGTTTTTQKLDLSALKASATQHASLFKGAAWGIGEIWYMLQLLQSYYPKSGLAGGLTSIPLSNQTYKAFLDLTCMTYFPGQTKLSGNLLKGVKMSCPAQDPGAYFATLQAEARTSAEHWNALAADPPDANTATVATLGQFPSFKPNTDDPVETALDDLGNHIVANGVVIDALRHTIERYQAASQSGTGTDMLLQAQAMRQYAALAIQSTQATDASFSDANAAITNTGFDFNALSSDLVSTQQELIASGLPPELTTDLQGSGFDSQQIATLLAMATSKAVNTPDPTVTLDRYQAVGPLAALVSNIQTSDTALIGQLQDIEVADNTIIADISSQMAIAPMSVTAGGPYKATVGSPVAFDASASVLPDAQAPFTYAWDLQGSGTFNDASGASPTFTFTAARSGFVGVAVSNALGQTTVAYAPITVAPASRQPTLGSFSPDGPITQVQPNTTARFAPTISGLAGDPITYRWTLDGVTVGSDSTYSRLFTSADSGVHSLTLYATNSGGTAVGQELVVVPGPVSLAMTPANQSLSLFGAGQYAVSGMYADGTTTDLSSTATWSTNNPTVAVVSPQGLVTAVGPGIANVSASVDGAAATTTVSVPAASPAPTSQSVTLFVSERVNSGVARVTIDSSGAVQVLPNFVTNLPARGPDSLVFDHHGHLVISNPEAGTISLADATTGAIVVSQVNSSPIAGVADLAMDPNSDNVYAIGIGPGISPVVRVSLVDGSVISLNPDSIANVGGITVTPDGKRLFVSNHLGGLKELDPATGHVLRSTVGPGIDGITYDPVSTFVIGSPSGTSVSCTGLCEFATQTNGNANLSFIRDTGVLGGADGLAADGLGNVYAAGGSCCLWRFNEENGAVTLLNGSIPSSDDVAPLVGAGAPPPAATTLSYAGDQRGDVDDPATIAAILTQSQSGTAVRNATIAFTLGTESCTGLTDSTGRAACSLSLRADGNPTNVVANFMGTSADAASSVTAAFVVAQEEDRIAYSGDTVFHRGQPGVVSGLLVEDGGQLPIAGRTLQFTLAAAGTSDSCTAVTDLTGRATCAIPTVALPGGNATVSQSFAGDASYAPASLVTAISVVTPITLTYTGDLSGDYADSTTLSATVVDNSSATPAPMLGVPLTFQLGADSCSAQTDLSGRAACTVILSGPRSSLALTAAYAGDATHDPASAAAVYNIYREQTVLDYIGSIAAFDGASVPLSVHLLADGDPSKPISGRNVSLTLAGQACSAVSDAGGAARCSVTLAQPAAKSTTLTAGFPGDAGALGGDRYGPSSISVPFLIEHQSIPSLTLLSPSSINSGAATQTLTLSGNGFNSTSVVNWGASTLPIMSRSATQITALLSQPLLLSPANVDVSVTNPGAGGGTSNVLSFGIKASNTPPTVIAPPAQVTNEGTATPISLGSFSDTDTNDTWTADINWGDGSARTTFAPTAAGPLGMQTHTYDDAKPNNAAYVVTVKVTDRAGTSDSKTFNVVVNSVPPTATLIVPNNPVNEGGTFSVQLANASEPSKADTAAGFSYAFDCGGGYSASGASSSTVCSAIDAPGVTVHAKVADEDGSTTEYAGTVLIANVPPRVGAIAAPTGPVQINTGVSATAPFTDPGVKDTHTAMWVWGDGTTSAGTVTESGGSGSVSGSHVYTTAGVYTVSTTVTDESGGLGQSTLEYVVAYDPNGGFVTGGGWFNSPSGACQLTTACGGATGKATFGFVSKYQNGATAPTGNTEFQFQAGNLDFHSTNYQWLVIAGSKAQYKGSGTINGQGNYGFLVTAVDGALPGGGGVDRLRIKVWADATGIIVYDNQMGAGDSSSPSTAIQGGSIVMHSP